MTQRMIDDGWHAHPAIEDWGADQRLVYLSLLLDPAISMCGCWRIALPDLSARTGLSRQRLAAVLPTLEPIAYWHGDIRLVWLPDYIKIHGKHPGVLRSARTDLDRLTGNDHTCLPATLREGLRRVREGLGNPPDPDPDPVPDRKEGKEGVPGEPSGTLNLAVSSPKPKRKKAPSDPKAHVYPEGFLAVYELWRHEREYPEHLQPSKTDVIHYSQRRKEGLTVADLRHAILGIQADDWLCGRDGRRGESHVTRDTFTLVLRNRELVLRLIPYGEAAAEDRAKKLAEEAGAHGRALDLSAHAADIEAMRRDLDAARQGGMT